MPPTASVRDTTGAGDYFAGGYIDAIVRGLDAGAAALAACKAAASRLASSEQDHAGGVRLTHSSREQPAASLERRHRKSHLISSIVHLSN